MWNSWPGLKQNWLTSWAARSRMQPQNQQARRVSQQGQGPGVETLAQPARSPGRVDAGAKWEGFLKRVWAAERWRLHELHQRWSKLKPDDPCTGARRSSSAPDQTPRSQPHRESGFDNGHHKWRCEVLTGFWRLLTCFERDNTSGGYESVSL